MARVARRGWNIWVDTGGTFTDAIGVDPSGRLQRAKILSTGAVRGVVDQVAGDRLRLRRGWDLPAGFFNGFRFRLLGEAAVRGTVSGYEPDPPVLVLAHDAAGRGNPASRLAAGAAPICRSIVVTCPRW